MCLGLTRVTSVTSQTWGLSAQLCKDLHDCAAISPVYLHDSLCDTLKLGQKPARFCTHSQMCCS